jgi:TPR repeat protein
VKAAEQGIAVALSNLAKSYMNGDGLPKDLHQAMILISAAQQRIPPTQYQLISRLNETRYSIAHLLSVEEARAAEKEAEKWTPGPGSLAKVLTDSANWKAGDSKPSTEHDAGG